MRRLIVVLAAVFAALSAHAQEPVDVPAALHPPAGQKLILQTHGNGVQIYTCTAAADGKYAWTLKGPQAELRDARGSMVIQHSAGPTWQDRDGSMVTGKVLAKENAPEANAVPWLLLQADHSRSNAGVLSKVTYIQRIHTDGGQPPATACDEAHKGDESRSDYSADYLFYAAER